MKKVQKIRKLNNLNNNFFTKKRLLIAGLASTVVVAPTLTTVAVIYSGGNSSLNKNYSFNGLNFNSIGDAREYVKKNSNVSTISDKGYDSTWEVEIDGKKISFNSTKDLYLYLTDQYVTQYVVKTNTDLNAYTNEWGEITDSNAWNHIFDQTAKANKIYQGFNDKTYTTEEEAYQSYFMPQNGYYFNGIFFQSREDLKQYLLTVFLPDKNLNPTKVNTIILHGPNGITSAPIDLTKPSASALLKSFITSNAIRSVTYVNSKTNEAISINDSNINDIINKINLNDLDYKSVKSNQGKSIYTIDNDTNDPNDLIGPYFYEGNLDVGAFMNKDMWKKVRGVSQQVFVESKIDAVVGSFFTSIINDDSTLILSESNVNKTAPVLFRTLLVDQQLNSYDEVFLNQLNAVSPELFNAVTSANLELLKGKKYNTFYKMAILYSFMMQRIISWGLGENVIRLVDDYFTDVCDFIQDAIELIILDKELLKSADGKSYFDMKTFFNIGNKNYDINTSVEYYMNELKTKYPKFVAAMGTYVAAQNNIVSFASLVPFEGIDLSYLVKYSLLSQEELTTITPMLKNIYDVFSQVNYNDMVNKYITVSNDPKFSHIKALSQDQWVTEFEKLYSTITGVPLGTMLKAIGTKNSTYYTMAESVLISEIQIYKQSGKFVKYGYLHKLYSNVPSLNKLNLFVDFVSKHEKEVSPFRIYMAFLLDKRMALGIFDSQNTSNVFSFTQAIIRLVMLTLGSAALVGSTAKSIYDTRSASSGRSSRGIFNDNSIGNDGNDKTDLKGPNHSPLLDAMNDTYIAKKIIVDENGNISDYVEESPKQRIGNRIGNNDSTTPKTFLAKEIDLNDARFLGPNDKEVIGFFGKVDSIITTGPAGVYLLDGREFWDCSVRERAELIDGLNLRRGLDGEKSIFTPSVDAIADCRMARASNGIDEYLTRLGLQVQNPWATREDIDDFAKNNRMSVDDAEKLLSSSMDVDLDIGSDTDSNKPSTDGGGSNTGTGNKPNKNPITRPSYPPPPPPSIDIDGNIIPPHPNYPAPSLDSDNPSLGENKQGRRFADWSKIKDRISNSTADVPDWFRSRWNDISARTSSWWSGARTRFSLDSITNVASTVLSHSLEIFGSLALGFEIAFLVYELLREVKTQDFYVYTAIDGTEWIWNGGLTTSKFFGFEVKQVHGIDEMILTNPVQITLPQIEEYYYYNQQKFYDPKDLILNQIEDVKNNNWLPRSNAFMSSFTLFTEGDNSYVFKANTIDELLTLVINDLKIVANLDGSYDTTSLNTKSEFLENTSTSLGSGVAVTSKDNYVTLANNISEKIRASKITVLPDVDASGASIGKISTPFVYPGNYWDGTKVVTQDPVIYEGKVVWDNSANLLKSGTQISSDKIITDNDFVTVDPVLAETNSKNNLYTTFKSKFSIPTKEVLASILKDKYGDMPSIDVGAILYKVTINGKSSFFTDETKVQEYLASILKLSKQSDETFRKVYEYYGNYFTSDKEIETWLLSQN